MESRRSLVRSNSERNCYCQVMSFIKRINSVLQRDYKFCPLGVLKAPLCYCPLCASLYFVKGLSPGLWSRKSPYSFIHTEFGYSLPGTLQVYVFLNEYASSDQA